MNRLYEMRVLVYALVAGAFIAGCAGRSPKAVAYLTLADTQATVRAAMNTYGDLYRAGKVTPETRRKVHEAHAKYRIAFDAAIDVAEFNYRALTPETVATLATSLLNTITQIQE